jgi:hypothetical protein
MICPMHSDKPKSTSHERRLISTGQVVWVMEGPGIGNQKYCYVLVPYTPIQQRNARRPGRCHLQLIRKERLAPVMRPTTTPVRA